MTDFVGGYSPFWSAIIASIVAFAVLRLCVIIYRKTASKIRGRELPPEKEFSPLGVVFIIAVIAGGLAFYGGLSLGFQEGLRQAGQSMADGGLYVYGAKEMPPKKPDDVSVPIGATPLSTSPWETAYVEAQSYCLLVKGVSGAAPIECLPFLTEGHTVDGGNTGDKR